MQTLPGITMPKNNTQTGDGGDQQPPRHFTGFALFDDEPEPHTHASTSTSEHADSIEPNLAEMTEPELYEFVSKTISSLHLYEWSSETGWSLTSWKEAQS